MSVWQIAWRNLMRRKLRTMLTTLSIVIGVASAFGVVASVESAKFAFPLYLKDAIGKADYTISGTDTYMPEDVRRSVEALDGVVSVAILRQPASIVTNAEGVAAIQKRVDLKGYSDFDTALSNFRVVNGSLGERGAVISDRTAQAWNVDVGDAIAFETDDGVKELTVSAVVGYTFELMGPSSWMMAKYHPWTVVVPLEDVQSWFGLEGKLSEIQVKAADGNVAEAGQRIDELTQSREGIYMQPVIVDFDSQFKDADTFFLGLYIAGFLGIALSAFVIFNTLYVSVQERRKEFAALKTIGYTPNQLRLIVLSEVLLLSIVGTAAGLAIGFGLAFALKTVIFMLFSVYDDSGVKLATGFIVSVLAGLAIPLLASLYPIRKAGKISVIEGMRDVRPEPAAGRNGFRLLLGAALVASSFFIKHLAFILPLLLGVALLFPHLFRAFAALLAPVYRKLFGVSGELAERNLRRNLGRTSMTSVVLCLGIAMIVLMSSLNSAFVQTYERAIHATYGGDLDVMLHHVEPEDLERLKATEGVAEAVTYGLQAAVWDLDGNKRKLPVYGVGADWIDRFPLFTTSGAPQSEIVGRLGEGEIALDRIAFGAWGGAIGDSITLDTPNGTKRFQVTAVVDTMKNSGYGAFLEIEQFRAHFGAKEERNALVRKDDAISPLQLRENVFDRLGSRVEEMFGPEDLASMVGAVYTGSFSVINFLIVLSTVISGIGITNTLLMNIMERVRELGMLRAVGVTRGQVVRTVMLEGFGIGLAATAIGSLFGIFLIYQASTFLEIKSLTYRFGVPWTLLLLIIAFGLAVSLISSFMPASRAAKIHVSEALRYE